MYELVREQGQYSKAVKSLDSIGIAEPSQKHRYYYKKNTRLELFLGFMIFQILKPLLLQLRRSQKYFNLSRKTRLAQDLDRVTHILETLSAGTALDTDFIQ
jgi:hypothetical protein